jgi:pilus assembly protein CpaF
VDQDGKIRGRMISTGIRPSFVEMFELAGIQMPPDMFASNRW